MIYTWVLIIVGCRCIGLEIREDLHAFAESIKGIYQTKMEENGFAPGDIRLIRVCTKNT